MNENRRDIFTVSHIAGYNGKYAATLKDAETGGIVWTFQGKTAAGVSAEIEYFFKTGDFSPRSTEHKHDADIVFLWM